MPPLPMGRRSVYSVSAANSDGATMSSDGRAGIGRPTIESQDSERIECTVAPRAEPQRTYEKANRDCERGKDSNNGSWDNPLVRVERLREEPREPLAFGPPGG